MASPQLEDGYTKIANEILDALARIRIRGEARQMLDVIIRKTYGFNKKIDKISTSQFMQLTGLPNYAVHKSRKHLVDMNIITITKVGDSQIIRYSIQKDYNKWKLLPKKVTVTNIGSHCNQKRSQTVTKKAIHKRKKDNIQKKSSWLSAFASIWYYYFEAPPHYGKAGKFLKPLVDKNGAIDVAKRLKTYLAFMNTKNQLEIANLAHFSEKYGLWPPNMDWSKSKKDWEYTDNSSSSNKLLSEVIYGIKERERAAKGI